MELNRWPALVVGFFRCLLGFSGGVSVVGFNCGVESVAGFDPFGGGISVVGFGCGVQIGGRLWWWVFFGVC